MNEVFTFLHVIKIIIFIYLFIIFYLNLNIFLMLNFTIDVHARDTDNVNKKIGIDEIDDRLSKSGWKNTEVLPRTIMVKSKRKSSEKW